jgi:hypothetical protein
VIKNGTEVDARRGVVEITRADGGVAKFYDGIFKLSQSGGITTLTLTEKLDCSKRALAAAAKPKTRKLWGDGKGKFRTKGQYSAATVRGTKWQVADACTTTATTVREAASVQPQKISCAREALRLARGAAGSLVPGAERLAALERGVEHRQRGAAHPGDLRVRVRLDSRRRLGDQRRAASSSSRRGRGRPGRRARRARAGSRRSAPCRTGR